MSRGTSSGSSSACSSPGRILLGQAVAGVAGGEETEGAERAEGKGGDAGDVVMNMSNPMNMQRSRTGRERERERVCAGCVLDVCVCV